MSRPDNSGNLNTPTSLYHNMIARYHSPRIPFTTIILRLILYKYLAEGGIEFTSFYNAHKPILTCTINSLPSSFTLAVAGSPGCIVRELSIVSTDSNGITLSRAFWWSQCGTTSYFHSCSWLSRRCCWCCWFSCGWCCCWCS